MVMTAVKTAVRIRDLGWDDDAALYLLQPQLVTEGVATHHVIVTALTPAEKGHGSVVFAATADGRVTSWAYLHRSHSADHAEVLAELGYRAGAT